VGDDIDDNINRYNFKRREWNEFNNNCFITNSIYSKSVEPSEISYLIRNSK